MTKVDIIIFHHEYEHKYKYFCVPRAPTVLYYEWTTHHHARAHHSNHPPRTLCETPQ
jgi:hypothetical protein